MRTEEIRFVAEVCRTGSMAGAARSLNITPQGLGKAIQKLEKELGVKLFTRTFEGVTPTSACNQIYEKLNDIVNAENAIREILGQIVSSTAPEEIFLISPNMVAFYIEQAVQEYNERFGGHIRVLESRLDDDMQEQTFLENKYAYRYCCKEIVKNRYLQKEDIVRMHFVPIVCEESPLLKKALVTYEDLSDKTLLVEEMTYPHIRLLLQTFDEKGLSRPAVKSVTTNTEITRMRLQADPQAVFFARARDKELIGAFRPLNFLPPFYTTLCLETHNETVNRNLLKIIREKMKDYNK